ncbi:MAG TPA: hypothetical protein VNI77_06505 [Nitrososphaera sp.]|nr:hypothetical protein [Nitrososphaera sp.]
MTLNRRSKRTILTGSVGGVVALVLGLFIADIYPNNNNSSTTHTTVTSDSELAQKENVADSQDLTAVSEEGNEESSNDRDRPINNTRTDWLVFSTPSNEFKTDEQDQQPVPIITTVSEEVEETIEPADVEPVVLDTILECSVPDHLRLGSTASFSAILYNSNLRVLPDQMIVWTISPGNTSFTSITEFDGTTEATPDLSDLTLGIYDVSATPMGQEGIACIDSFAVVRGGGGGGGSGSSSDGSSSNPDDDTADDITKPELRITMPTAGEVFSGPSSGGIPVLVTGIASDESGIQTVEVRWTAWYGLTGYRMASPSSPDDWSIWEYDQIKFNTEGTKTILVKATDKQGDNSWKAVTFDVTFTTDNTKPFVAITAPEEESIITGQPDDGDTVTVTVNGTASDIYTGVQIVEVRTDSTGYQQATPTSPGDWSSWSCGITFTAPGPHQIVARVTDNVGNMQWHILNVIVELEPPA